MLKEMLWLLEQPPTQREEALHIQCLVIEIVLIQDAWQHALVINKSEGSEGCAERLYRSQAQGAC